MASPFTDPRSFNFTSKVRHLLSYTITLPTGILCQNTNNYTLSTVYKIMKQCDVDIKINKFLYNYETNVCRSESKELIKIKYQEGWPSQNSSHF